MALTEKGKSALHLIEEYFQEGIFSAKSLNEISGENIAAASLTALAKHGFLNRIESTPVTYTLDKDFLENYIEEVSIKKGSDNGNLRAAKKNKNDEFYTRREDIEAELCNYRKYFIGKSVFLNCDDPRESEFWKYFERQFGFLQLKKLISTHYEENGKSYKLEYFGDVDENGEITEAQIIKTPLNGNGDFRSEECIKILDECDVVVTNPPFSLFREYIDLLVKHNKQFLVIGNKNAITYKEIFSLIKQNKLWLGMTNPQDFYISNSKNERILSGKMSGLTRWFTNLPTKNRSEEFSTGARYYDENHKLEDYPKYDNYDAIEVGKVKNIPMDYEGVIGVPITFLDKYNPEQFEILGDSRYHDGNDNANDINFVDGVAKYRRILIRNKHPRRSRNKK